LQAGSVRYTNTAYFVAPEGTNAEFRNGRGGS